MNCGPRLSSLHLRNDATLTRSCLATSSSVYSVNIFTSLPHYRLIAPCHFGARWPHGTVSESGGPCFKAFECVKQLEASLAHRVAGHSELFRVLDCELDSVNRNAGLVGHLKFHR